MVFKAFLTTNSWPDIKSHVYSLAYNSARISKIFLLLIQKLLIERMHFKLRILIKGLLITVVLHS